MASAAFAPTMAVMINNPMTDLAGVTLKASDLYTIKRKGDVITYYQNDVALPWTTNLPTGTGPLYVYAFMQGMGTQMAQAIITTTDRHYFIEEELAQATVIELPLSGSLAAGAAAPPADVVGPAPPREDAL